MEMRGPARAAATTAALALVLTSCGLAALSTPALAPELAARPHAPAAPAPEHAAPAEPAAGLADTLLQKAAAEPAVAAKPTLPAASLGPTKHIWQTLNNCGPAAVVMALSTLGVDADQETARLALRGPDPRRGMGPGPVDPWVRDLYGLRSTYRTNGTNALVKALVSNGFAPMVTQWMEDPSVSRVAHWRTVVGYDDARGVFYVNDSMRGKGVALAYDWFDRNWQPFSYRWMVLFRAEDEPLLRAIVGADWSERTMRQRYHDRARGEALERGDAASWLAYGEAAYQNGYFAEAVAAFEEGLSLGSAQGVFTLRSSYPRALAALGREQDAARAQQQLGGISAVPATVAPAPDSLALQLAQERTQPAAVRLTD